MAEAIILTGVAAAAVQFIDVGLTSLQYASLLISRFKDAPQSLKTAQDQVRLLLRLAGLASRKFSIQSGPNSDSVLHVPSGVLDLECSLRLQEAAWRKCTEQARQLEQILGSVLCETEDSRVRRLRKRIFSLRRDRAICRIVDEIERCKSTLTLWYGQECLQNIYTVEEGAGGLADQLSCLVRNKFEVFCFCYLFSKATRGGSTVV